MKGPVSGKVILLSVGSSVANNVPRLLVYNKIDCFEQGEAGKFAPRIDRDESGRILRVFISAKLGQGMELLALALAELLGEDSIETEVMLTPEKAKLRSVLYQKGAVVTENIDEQGNHYLLIRLPRVEFERLFR